MIWKRRKRISGNIFILGKIRILATQKAIYFNKINNITNIINVKVSMFI